jgi:hypothetical protein
LSKDKKIVCLHYWTRFVRSLNPIASFDLTQETQKPLFFSFQRRVSNQRGEFLASILFRLQHCHVLPSTPADPHRAVHSHCQTFDEQFGRHPGPTPNSKWWQNPVWHSEASCNYVSRRSFKFLPVSTAISNFHHFHHIRHAPVDSGPGHREVLHHTVFL